MFECSMKSTTTQKAFLANTNSKPRLIKTFTAKVQCAGVLLEQDLADGDHFIVSTALTSAQTEMKLVFTIGTAIDLLVILIIYLCWILFRYGHVYNNSSDPHMKLIRIRKDMTPMEREEDLKLKREW